ncbi:H-2 class I histocompatibility antigen, Q10 alpha chain-like isoform X2 [Mus caroli]|uniref:H-2 class I histocompatibility antigen, Q10 alpha chain-like isoform X2 n=2 Tax=Mus caroli TaxID=10089 RepID=A0A6P5R8D8_MUSCR|nr:H-2 class I histocompatibility antigen, Q10 alpha chain-like isoform X2 [Mus caroli]
MSWVLRAAVVCALLLQQDASPSLWVRGRGLIALLLPGSHSLRYFYTAVSRPGLGEPWFIIVGYVDDMQVLRFSSKEETPRMAPWLEQEEADDWKQQTRIVTIQGQLSERNLMTLVHFYNKSVDDSHTLQWLQGCDVEPDRRLCLWYNQLAYDSEDLPTLNENPSSCTVGNSTVPHISQHLKSHCSDLLQKYLEKGKERLLRSDPPKTHVTHHPRPEDEVTLRCWALGFYPADITLTWQKDGEELIQEMEFVETRPAGDGTFQKWATVVVPLGEEQNYTCHVHHEGLPEPLTLRWEPAWYQKPWIWIVAMVFSILLICLCVACICMKKNAGGRGRPDTQEAGKDSPQDSSKLVQDDEEMGVPFWKIGYYKTHLGHSPGTSVGLSLLSP